MSERCGLCHGLGWLLDSNRAGLLGLPRQAELIPCIHPECEASGAELGSLVFKGVEFRHVARHPSEGWVMSLSRGESETINFPSGTFEIGGQPHG